MAIHDLLAESAISRRRLLGSAAALALGARSVLNAAEPEKGAGSKLLFDTKDNTESPQSAPEIPVWKTLELDAECGGYWVVAGDIDGDGEVEIVSAQNVNEGDVHYTSAVAAQKLDGRVLWRWGRANVGRRGWHHDVACQIHDWDGDGKMEVVLATQGALVVLDGATGKERRRFAIPEQATDSLVFCDLEGRGRRGEVLVKDRYWNIYAYDQKGAQLWTVANPGGYRTAHQPRPIDIDGDGREEIMAGYALLNPDGTVRWVCKSEIVDMGRGHLDCCRVLRRGSKPEEFRLALTYCGANCIAVVDGLGKTVWEVGGQHFESIDVGRVLPSCDEPQIVVDIDHQPDGQGPIWVFDADGKNVGRLMTNYARHHCLIDWDGDGLFEIFVGEDRGVYNHRGERIRTLELPNDYAKESEHHERSLVPADMTGDGRPDLLLVSPRALHVYRNEKGAKWEHAGRLGSEPNFTLY